MSRSPRRATPQDSQLHALSDADLLDFLDRARRRFACTDARSGDAAAYAGALSALELEAVRRRLDLPAVRERPPVWTLIRRLARVPPGRDPDSEWPRLLAELGLPGLWLVYLWVQDNLEPDERVVALAHLNLAVDRIVYGDRVAHTRYLKYVELPPTPELRLARIYEALEATFGLVFDRLAEEGNGT